MLEFNQEGLLGRGIFNLAPRQLGLIQTVSVVVVKQPLEKWYFVSKIVLVYCEKKCSSDWDFFFQIWSWMPRICKNHEVTRTIYSKRSEHFFETGYFLTCYWRFQSDLKHRTIKMSIGTNNWIVGKYRNKLEKLFLYLVVHCQI